MLEGEKKRIGFIGFGEVGRAFCKRFIEQGAGIVVYDKYPERVEAKAREMKAFLTGAMEDLVKSSDLILAAVWPDTASEVAKEASRFLSSSQVYCDLNSISPETTLAIQQDVSSGSGDFVKIAIMASILDRGFEVPLLAGGTKAEEVRDILSGYGFKIRTIGSDPCQAAAMKILRSVCLKGIVAVAYEMIRGAQKYGVVEQVLDSASEVIARESLKKFIGDSIASTAIHARRRAKEMEEAIETLDKAGISPVMSRGTKGIFEEMAGFDLDELFKGQVPDSYREVLEAIAKRTS